MCEPPALVTVSSPFGVVSILWRETALGPRVARIVLPNEHVARDLVSTDVPAAVRELAQGIGCTLEGQRVNLALDLLALETCSDFQRRTLVAKSKVPRGWVTTYGRIARYVGVPQGARAVGRALACNPFPIVIPCHRAIRSDGALGGFRGGLALKRALLELEGIAVSEEWRVPVARYFY